MFCTYTAETSHLLVGCEANKLKEEESLGAGLLAVPLQVLEQP
jgi:hypothetical protein